MLVVSQATSPTASPRPIVLKSPPHTARVRTLLELFPQREICAHRPRSGQVVFLSTLRLWRSLYQVQGLQVDNGDDVTRVCALDVRANVRELRRGPRRCCSPISTYEVRYEDLVAIRWAKLQRHVSRSLSLGDFEHVRPQLRRIPGSEERLSDESVRSCPTIVRGDGDGALGDFARRYGYRRRMTMKDEAVCKIVHHSACIVHRLASAACLLS